MSPLSGRSPFCLLQKGGECRFVKVGYKNQPKATANERELMAMAPIAQSLASPDMEDFWLNERGSELPSRVNRVTERQLRGKSFIEETGGSAGLNFIAGMARDTAASLKQIGRNGAEAHARVSYDIGIGVGSKATFIGKSVGAMMIRNDRTTFNRHEVATTPTKKRCLFWTRDSKDKVEEVLEHCTFMSDLTSPIRTHLPDFRGCSMLAHSVDPSRVNALTRLSLANMEWYLFGTFFCNPENLPNHHFHMHLLK